MVSRFPILINRLYSMVAIIHFDARNYFAVFQVGFCVLLTCPHLSLTISLLSGTTKVPHYLLFFLSPVLESVISLFSCGGWLLYSSPISLAGPFSSVDSSSVHFYSYSLIFNFHCSLFLYAFPHSIIFLHPENLLLTFFVEQIWWW